MSGKIPKLNGKNEVIGETTIAEAVENGWPRRIVRVFIFDGSGSILLQRRSETIKSYAGLWDQAAAGHVDVGETSLNAALRELHEELGVMGVELSEVVNEFRNTASNDLLYTFDTLYKLELPQNTPINFDLHEVAEVAWLPISELERRLVTELEQFVPPFVNVWENYRELLIQ